MKRLFTYTPFILLILASLGGCSLIGAKTASLVIIYAATAVLSLFLLLGYLYLVRNRNIWFLLLFSSVLIVNTGYLWLATSSTLGQALMANRLSYLGSVMLPLSMLMIILEVTRTTYSKRLPRILLNIAVIVFLIAASPGILDIYYRDVSFAVVNGVSTLVKVYGPLHSLYLFYLLGYFGTMVGVIISASAKKQIDTTAHAVILAIAVLVNIGVWFIEQLSHIEFEMLSVSYIITELFLLGVHLMVNENQRLNELLKEAKTVQNILPERTAASAMLEHPDSAITPDRDCYEIFMNGLENLTQTERAIYEAYIARVTTKEVMAMLNIKENTLKFHNKNIYSKLGVSSRKELLEIYKQLKMVNGCNENNSTSSRNSSSANL